ncbi:hypothetical protein EMIHUDRAFT_457596 [Emiliania huxleyi CCMP1516]|uniref:Uncharacterized protein n=2 Tax=Emiliania huxleyi TaxID=2903 RepID=A0A0D3JPA1_EMIH1|nr:hypothetical protein EMIHUDRAFT_457596 [Emiliania huxleyi CCMP1516]EOD25336.1 hypothetical protein EMIHUDRAFT_457596 [Emiliania huxleyi CCMP1516]|eukprot:XP_005777765.1 hypothetical protein EMIHUDRAFT_457596 [Emiliania huxleyi CCMP1516]
MARGRAGRGAATRLRARLYRHPRALPSSPRSRHRPALRRRYSRRSPTRTIQTRRRRAGRAGVVVSHRRRRRRPAGKRSQTETATATGWAPWRLRRLSALPARARTSQARGPRTREPRWRRGSQRWRTRCRRRWTPTTLRRRRASRMSSTRSTTRSTPSGSPYGWPSMWRMWAAWRPRERAGRRRGLVVPLRAGLC